MQKNVNIQRSFISLMNREEKIIFVRTLLAIARSDKKLDKDEKTFIKDIGIIFGLEKSDINEIVAPLTNDELLALVSKITKREVALQLIKEACFLANSDSNLNNEEIILIGDIGKAMNVELEKIEEISNWVVDRIVWLERGKIIFEQV